MLPTTQSGRQRNSSSAAAAAGAKVAAAGSNVSSLSSDSSQTGPLSEPQSYRTQDSLHIKLSSAEHNANDKPYKVAEMAYYLKNELKKNTYENDGTLFFKLFPSLATLLGLGKSKREAGKSLSEVELETAIVTVLESLSGKRPAFITAYFQEEAANQKKTRRDTLRPPKNQASTSNQNSSQGSKRASTTSSGSHSANSDTKGSTSDDSPDVDEFKDDSGTYFNTKREERAAQAAQAVEDSEEGQLAQWLNHIREEFNHVRKKNGLEGTARGFDASSSTTPVKGLSSSEDRKPDILLLRNGLSKPLWPLSLVVIEITRTRNFPDRTMTELPQRAELILRETPTRRFVIIIVISHRQFMISVFHRSGVNFSTKFDIVTDIRMFYTAIAGILYMSEQHLGMDPDFTMSPLGRPKKIKFQGESFTVVKVIFIKEGIQCRGTVCLELRHDKTGKTYMMKICWVDPDDPHSEIFFYDILKALRIKGVPIMVGYEDVSYGNFTDSTTYWQPRDAEHFPKRQHRRILLDGVGRPITEFVSRRELLSGIIDILYALYRLADGAYILHQDISLGNMLLVDHYPDYANYAKGNSPFKPKVVYNTRNRSATVSAVSTAQTDNATPEDQKTTAAARARQNKALGKLVGEDDIYEQLARGLLVDFDYAFCFLRRLLAEMDETDLSPLLLVAKATLDAADHPSMRPSKLRTGTLPYMAIQVLLGRDSDEEPFDHTAANDIESVIYGLMKICIHQAGPGGTRRDFDVEPVPAVYSGVSTMVTEMWSERGKTFADIGMAKVSTWTHLEKYTLSAFHTYFEEFKDMFREISEALFPSKTMELEDYNRRIRSKVTHMEIIKIMTKYRDALPMFDDNYVPKPLKTIDEEQGSAPDPRRSTRLSQNN